MDMSPLFYNRSLSIDLSLRMGVHSIGHTVSAVLGRPISMAVVHMELCHNRSETSKGS